MNMSMAAFRNICTALMLTIARLTHKQLARQVAYLQAENQLLQSRVTGKIILTRREKNRFVSVRQTSQYGIRPVGDYRPSGHDQALVS